MSVKNPQRLVVDANIMQSAGTTTNPMSINCREFLETLQQCGHLVVSTPKIRKEWEKHSSRFSLKWMSKMESKKRVAYLRDEENDELRERTSERLSGTKLRELLKDMHLLEAALITDQLIASGDKKVLEICCEICDRAIILQSIIWVNPTVEEEQACHWLQAGAKKEKKRMIRATR